MLETIEIYDEYGDLIVLEKNGEDNILMTIYGDSEYEMVYNKKQIASFIHALKLLEKEIV